jgi:hypothetical protein
MQLHARVITLLSPAGPHTITPLYDLFECSRIHLNPCVLRWIEALFVCVGLVGRNNSEPDCFSNLYKL